MLIVLYRYKDSLSAKPNTIIAQAVIPKAQRYFKTFSRTLSAAFPRLEVSLKIKCRNVPRILIANVFITWTISRKMAERQQNKNLTKAHRSYLKNWEQNAAHIKSYSCCVHIKPIKVQEYFVKIVVLWVQYFLCSDVTTVGS